MKEFYNEAYLRCKGLVFGGRYVPYNPDLQGRAKDMRKNMTFCEQKIWNEFLRKFNQRGPDKITILKQKVIDNYIVDFYIPKYNLIIEIDGESHNDRAGYDAERTKILEGYGLQEVRISNYDIENNFLQVCHKLQKYLGANVPAPL